jgi:hypothetical protein
MVAGEIMERVATLAEQTFWNTGLGELGWPDLDGKLSTANFQIAQLIYCRPKGTNIEPISGGFRKIQ